jgi:hypothetical protein
MNAAHAHSIVVVALPEMSDRELENCWLTLAILDTEIVEKGHRVWAKRLQVAVGTELEARRPPH